MFRADPDLVDRAVRVFIELPGLCDMVPGRDYSFIKIILIARYVETFFYYHSSERSPG